MPAALVTSAKVNPRGAAGAPKRLRGAKAAFRAKPPAPATNWRRFMAAHASWEIDQPIANGVHHQLGGFVNAQRVHDIGAMHGHGVGAETQIDGNFLIRFS